MESYGTILKKAREEKGLSIDTIERETTIAGVYLEAMEAEDTYAFPGEPYLVGFLKNYAEYLGLDSAEILTLYHAKKIQESPVPTELLAKKKPKFILPMVITIVILALIGGGCYLYFGVFKVPEVKAEKERERQEALKPHKYEFSGTTETHRMYKGDQIVVPERNGTGNIILTVADTKGVLTLETPAGNQILALSEERQLDIDGDGTYDIILYLSDIGQTDGSRGAEVRMLLKGEESDYIFMSDYQTNEDEIDTVDLTDGNQKVIFEDTRAYPFTINVVFRGTNVFRYKVDRQKYIESYYKSGEQVTVTASNGIRIWTSNSNAMKIQVIADTSTYDLEIGKAGEVGVEDIKWVRDSDGKYRLVVIELD